MRKENSKHVHQEPYSFERTSTGMYFGSFISSYDNNIFGMLFHNYKCTCMNFLQIIERLTKATTATITHIPDVSIKLKDLKSRQSYK